MPVPQGFNTIKVYFAHAKPTVHPSEFSLAGLLQVMTKQSKPLDLLVQPYQHGASMVPNHEGPNEERDKKVAQRFFTSSAWK